MLLVLLAGCSRAPELPAAANALDIERPLSHWAEGGFFRVTPPVQLPSYDADEAMVEIWVKLPDDGKLHLEERSDGRLVLGWPPGSVADRVEYRGRGDDRYVVDVRGTRLDETGRAWDHIYRPTERTPDASLFGYEWPYDDEAAHAGVKDVMAHRAGDVVRKKMHCRTCHEAKRPDNVRPDQHGIVNRGTDGDGWFTPTTALFDFAPVETYGRHHAALADPWVDVRCADGAVLREPNDKGGTFATCETGGVPVATRRVAEALAAGDPITRAICDVRARLWAHLTADERARLPQSCVPQANSNEQSK